MTRLLIKYAKTGDAALLSHRETMRILERALRRSDIPLVFSAGFNPRPRMSFAPALPLGVAADAEYMEVSVENQVDSSEARERINVALPEGLKVSEVQVMASNMPKLSKWTRYGLYRITGPDGDKLLLLQLGGDKQGRLRDALEDMSERWGRTVHIKEVTRMGLYASRYEVFEDVGGPVYEYDGEKQELVEIEGE
jgi:radical SAM-linked protein